MACRYTAPQPGGTSPTCISPDTQPWSHGEASQELGKVRAPYRGPEHGVGMGVELAKTPVLCPDGSMWGPALFLAPCSLPLPTANWFPRGLDQQLLSR